VLLAEIPDLSVAPQLVQIGPGGQKRHDSSLITPWSAPRPEEIVSAVACHLVAEVDSILPTDPAAPSSAGHRFYLSSSRRVPGASVPGLSRDTQRRCEDVIGYCR